MKLNYKIRIVIVTSIVTINFALDCFSCYLSIIHYFQMCFGCIFICTCIRIIQMCQTADDEFVLVLPSSFKNYKKKWTIIVTHFWKWTGQLLWPGVFLTILVSLWPCKSEGFFPKNRLFFFWRTRSYMYLNKYLNFGKFSSGSSLIVIITCIQYVNIYFLKKFTINYMYCFYSKFVISVYYYR